MLVANICQEVPENKLNQYKEQRQINILLCTKYGVGAMKETILFKLLNTGGFQTCKNGIHEATLHATPLLIPLLLTMHIKKGVFVNAIHDLKSHKLSTQIK